MAENVRRRPSQGRSRETVEAILEATTQILVERGSGGLTTNHAAARAGVSIGTLYQYFANKQGLVRAVVEQHVSRVLGHLQEVMLGSESQSLGDRVRTFVRAMIEAHRIDPELHRACVEQALVEDPCFVFGIQAQATTLVEAALIQYRDVIRAVEPAVAAYVLVVCVDNLVHTALLDSNAPSLDTLEGEIVAFIFGYLGICEAS